MRSPSKSCSRRHGRSCIPACWNGCRYRMAARSHASIPSTNSFETDFATHKADVGNVIPPQRAGRIAAMAGVADRTGWCPIDPVTFESQLQPGIHVIGDAAIGGAMPKSAFAANAQAKVCAYAMLSLLAGATPAGAASDQYLLQPRCAWLRFLGRRRVSSGQWPAHRNRGRRRHQSARRAGRVARAGSETMRTPGSRRSR